MQTDNITIPHREKAPKVSVCVVTFNQEKYIRKCLQSIIDQKTDFEFEVLVADDCSVDGTRALIAEYANKYPNIVKPIFHENNIGPLENFNFVHQQATGTYIAHIDGDDLWYPGKLQSQVNILDSNPAIAIAAHDMVEILENGIPDIKKRTLTTFPELGSVYDLFRFGCYFHNSSKMYRRTASLTNSHAFPVVDFYLHIEHSCSGSIYFSKTCFGAYRVHGQGISKDSKFKRVIREAYDRAYDRANELGLNELLVERGRIRHSQAAALSFLSRGDLISFSNEARIEKSRRRYASIKQLSVHLLSFIPRVAKALLLIRFAIRERLGIFS